MGDPIDQRGDGKAGLSWRLSRSGDDRRFDSSDQMTFELADADGYVVASFSIPSEKVTQLLGPNLSTFAELQLDGTVSLDTELSSEFEAPLQRIDILQMVSDALAQEMLEDEPDAKEQLTVLRQRLNEALALVDQTLADLS